MGVGMLGWEGWVRGGNGVNGREKEILERIYNLV
jgi:hypothetical protein